MTDHGDAPIYALWADVMPVLDNWGDKLNPALIHALSKREVRHIGTLRHEADSVERHLVIGSALDQANDRTVVWGQGYMRTDTQISSLPRRVCAVRGPLSRAKLIEFGGEVPEIYGDPGLLYRLLYRPSITPRYDIGLIRHCCEADLAVPLGAGYGSQRCIDINASLTEVVDAILSCRRIVSSSLHGIIAAHSYGVPACWIRLSNRPFGDGFKFRDYFQSVGIACTAPAEDLSNPRQLTFTTLDEDFLRSGSVIETLLRACPFIAPDVLDALLPLCGEVGRRPGEPPAGT